MNCIPFGSIDAFGPTPCFLLLYLEPFELLLQTLIINVLLQTVLGISPVQCLSVDFTAMEETC